MASIDEICTSSMVEEHDAKYQAAVASNKFRTWLKNGQVLPSEIGIRDVKMFGANPGFVVGEMKIKYESGKPAPGYFVVRGGAVTVLVRVNARWIFGVQQLRGPVLKKIREAVAGMLDENGNLKGAAVAETEEELGITIPSNDLVYLFSFYTSPGLLDEKVVAYLVDVQVPEERMHQLLTKVTGTADEEITPFCIDSHAPDYIQQVEATEDCKLMLMCMHVKLKNM